MREILKFVMRPYFKIYCNKFSMHIIEATIIHKCHQLLETLGEVDIRIL